MIRAQKFNPGSGIDAFIASKLAALTPQLEIETREIARQAAVELANETFPKGSSPEPVALAAIAKDIRRVFITAGEVFGLLRERFNPRLASAFYRTWKEQQISKALRILRQAGGDFARLEFGPVSSTLHEAARSGPRRRVTLPFPIRIVPEADRSAYISRVQKQLGQAAAGWSACAAILGGESGIPAWKSTAVHGSEFGNVQPMQGTKIGFILRNVSPHARRNLPAGAAASIAASASRKLAERLAG